MGGLGPFCFPEEQARIRALGSMLTGPGLDSSTCKWMWAWTIQPVDQLVLSVVEYMWRLSDDAIDANHAMLSGVEFA